ncbi:MAG: hypothetical protein K9W44_18265 [Candidatus Lokiarchaeota archaeon]|nr:hypothetical protein [Candidatus Harpocratesius repetitus]
MHGLPIENCPHCAKNMGIKPPTQLIHPAPREIPMPVPYKEYYLSRIDLNRNPLFTMNPSINREISPLSRKFSLDIPHESINESLFIQRKNKLEEKYKTSREAEELIQPNSNSLIDLKKKFTTE